jgi:hypothetical protein
MRHCDTAWHAEAAVLELFIMQLLRFQDLRMLWKLHPPKC